MDNYFNTNLKHLRVTNGLRQEELGKRLKKDYSTIGKWENGTRSPIMEDVIKVAEIFNVDLKDLLLKDLRLNIDEKGKDNIKNENNDDKYKKILKDKGLMDENEKIKEEDFNRLIKIADMIQETIDKKKEN